MKIFPIRSVAYNANGDQLWSREDIELPVDPVVRLHSDGLILLCDSNGRLIALELDSGEERWQRAIRTFSVFSAAQYRAKRVDYCSLSASEWVLRFYIRRRIGVPE